MKLSLLAAGMLMVFMPGCTQQQAQPYEAGISKQLAEFRKSIIHDIRYDLSFHIPADQSEKISGVESIEFELRNDTKDVPLDFRADRSFLQSLKINGKPSQINYIKEHLILPAEQLQKGTNRVHIKFIAGETSLNRNPEYLYTLFVPDRARTAFPLFDQPDLKAIFELELHIPSDWTALSNAPVIESDTRDSTKKVVFAPSDLISSYLFSFVAGKFQSVTQEHNGRNMTMLHRETDEDKVRRNTDDIFKLHAASLKWLEEYTGITYPFKKFDFVLIPAFQYGGMEHVGAIQYNASRMFLDKKPTASRLLSRASLIAHETAHMWFGNLVTMEWFNDVWTKEVFANFMAAKIMNPNYSEINHDLNFLLRHHPSSYSVDRTEGANPIRQTLKNLNEAGQMYGAIIYNKAPVMMHQLEELVGKETFKEGMQNYLNKYSFNNATWPDLIEILDAKTDMDLNSWSDVWVHTAGRPDFMVKSRENRVYITQQDPSGENRLWPQKFELLSYKGKQNSSGTLVIDDFIVESNVPADYETLLFNADGRGYGLFPAKIEDLKYWNRLDDVGKGTLIINLYENMLAERGVEPEVYFKSLLDKIQTEQNQLILNEMVGQLQTIYWDFLTAGQRDTVAPDVEQLLWKLVIEEQESSKSKMFFKAFQTISLSEHQVEKLYEIWSGEREIEKLNLSETDFVELAGTLALHWPDRADKIVDQQLAKIKNSDRKRRFEFVKPALAASQKMRDHFFESLKNEENRRTESWVLDAVGFLHHPLRVNQSEKYIMPSLQLLQEIQVTGDIFFPKRWLDATLSHYSSDKAVEIIRTFLRDHPDYNEQLRMKILQSADKVFRANRIKKKNPPKQTIIDG